jgi:CheY-like chemotaxis protein
MNSTQAPLEQEARMPGAESATPSALVVDDNAVNRNITSFMLRKLGWEALPVASGAAALEALQQRRFDLMLLDLRMQDMDGVETCRRVREDLKLQDLSIAAYTAHSMDDDRERLFAAGFNHLLIKPLFADDLKAVCERTLAGRRLKDAC